MLRLRSRWKSVTSSASPVDARKGQRVEAPGAHLGEKVAELRQQRPVVAAQIVQIEAERLADSSSKIVCARRQRAGVDRRPGQLPLELLLELERVDADERGGERRLDRVGAGEQPHLPALFRRRGRESHRAVAEQHQRRDALRRFRRRTRRPVGSRSSKSTDLITRSRAANCLSGCSDRRCSPSIDDSRSCVDDAPRLALGRRRAAGGCRAARS